MEYGIPNSIHVPYIYVRMTNERANHLNPPVCDGGMERRGRSIKKRLDGSLRSHSRQEHDASNDDDDDAHTTDES